MAYGIHNRNGKLLSGRFNEDLASVISKEDYNKLSSLYNDYNIRLKALKNFHHGSTIHVFGSGPSLNDVAVRVNWGGHITIGVNGVPKVIENLKYWLMIDDFMNQNDEVKNWIRKWFFSNNVTETFVRRGLFSVNDYFDQVAPNYIVDHAAFGPVSDLEHGLFYGKSSAVAAADLARHLGAKRIILWGCDYNNREHAYKVESDDGKRTWPMAKINEEFKQLLLACKDDGIELLNASPVSALTSVPKVDPIGFTDEFISIKEESKVSKVSEVKAPWDVKSTCAFDFESNICYFFGTEISISSVVKEYKFLQNAVKRLDQHYLDSDKSCGFDDKYGVDVVKVQEECSPNIV